MDEEFDIRKESIKIDFKPLKKRNGLECDLIFGMSAYKIDTEKGTIELIQPYTKEFDDLMFNNIK